MTDLHINGAIFNTYVEERKQLIQPHGVLLDVQPEDNEPVELTHYDCWFTEDGEADLNAYLDAEHEELAAKAAEIIQAWEQSLNMDLLTGYSEELSEDLSSTIERLGTDLAFDLVIIKLLRAGYHVYSGDNFIEVYQD